MRSTCAITVLRGTLGSTALLGPRQFRADFAWVDRKFLVEIEGVTSFGAIGRHQSASGFETDCIKYEIALIRGWRVYRVPHTWIVKKTGRSYRRIWRPEVASVIRQFVGSGS